ncbi:MAG: hypothetical protein NTV00_01755 [Methylococcales bacterium]|nr:hypothetical protein [Methylococcales bacterium]
MRPLAEKAGYPKITVHNHLKAQKKRNQHPESCHWETESSDAWLKLFLLPFYFTLA